MSGTDLGAEMTGRGARVESHEGGLTETECTVTVTEIRPEMGRSREEAVGVGCRRWGAGPAS